jgi:dihydroorotate dehydrogenase
MHWLKRLCSIGFTRRLLQQKFAARQQPVRLWGLPFTNPVGLAAGFDKNAAYLHELQVLGFGHVEIGTVTPQPQPGNDKPRLFRLPKDKALINRMGFNNEGADMVAERLKAWRQQHPAGTGMIIGGNIGKNKVTPNEYAYMDYDICFRKLYNYVDYFVVNVSSPNTPGLRELQDKDALRTILTHLQEIRAGMPLRKPLLLKIAPDLEPEQLDDVASLAIEIALDGLVATNTTTTRSSLNHEASRLKAAEAGAGGLSGQPVKEMSTAVLKHLAGKMQGKIPIIASGGIFTASDAREKLEAGASLVQVWTGFVYEGPAIAKNICTGL